jgi:hypothetical protein
MAEQSTTATHQEKMAPAENLKPTESIATAPHTIANALMAIEEFMNAK